MAVFTFIGDQRPLKDKRGNSLKGQGPDVLRVFGMEFPKGTPVEVSDAKIAAKLRGNQHFREGGVAERAQAVPAETGPAITGNEAIRQEAAAEEDAALDAKVNAAPAAPVEETLPPQPLVAEGLPGEEVENGEDPFPLN